MIAHVAGVPVVELLLLVSASVVSGAGAGLLARLADAAPTTPTGARAMTYDKTMRIESSV